MVMSRDPRSKFRKIVIFLNSAFNIRKRYKISSRKALYFRSYQPRRREGYSPNAFSVKRQVNPLDEYGNPQACHVCGSIFHFAERGGILP